MFECQETCVNINVCMSRISCGQKCLNVLNHMGIEICERSGTFLDVNV